MKRASILAVAALLLITGVAVADHRGPGGPGGQGPDGGFGGGAIVGSDGTIYITSESTTNGTNTESVTAISSTGAKKWTATLSGHGRLLLSDGNLIQASETRNSDGTFTTTLTAISTASGSTAWTKTVSGRITELIPFNGGTYAFVVTPATTSGGAATRSIVAYGNDGSVLWTVAL